MKSGTHAWEGISDLPPHKMNWQGVFFFFLVVVVIFSTHIVLALQRNRAKWSLSIKIYYKKLAHMIMEAEKSHSFLCVSQRPEKLVE